MPHLPQDCDSGAAPHVCATGPAPGAPDGTGAAVCTGDHGPHSGTAEVLAEHAVLTTTVAEGVLTQTPAGSAMRPALRVQSALGSLPWSRTIQQPLAPQTPALPGGNWS